MISCTNCGRANEDHYRFCLGCGTPLGDARRAAAKPVAPAPDPLASWGAVDDSGLGWSSPTAAVPAQAAPVPVPRPAAAPERGPDPWSASSPISSLAAGPAPAGAPMGRRCVQCGATVPEGFVFCGQCGARWSEGAAMRATPSIAARDDRVVARLVVLRPDGAPGDTISLRDGESVLGREGTISFPSDRLLSQRHATLFTRAGRLYVRDEGSLNGVFLKLGDERELKSGDVFRIGQQLLRYDDKRDYDVLVMGALGDDTYVLGSPDLGYWGRLVQILTRTRVGNVFLLAGNEVTLGRERAQIAFPFDGFVSSTHAALNRRGERTFLADRGSSNGTYVRVVGEALLEHGSLILAGQNLLRVELFLP